MFTLLLTILTGLIGLYYLRRRKPKNYPPGLPSIPILGSLPFMDPNLKATISKLRKRFGRNFSLRVGPDDWVILCDFNLAKEALGREDFQDRPTQNVINDFFFRDKDGQVRGLFFSNGDEWKEQRRFTIRNLKDFGFGKIGMEPLIHDEIQKSIDMIKKDISLGEKVSLNLRLNVAILNALWQVITGEKLDYEDPRLKEIVSKLNLLFTGTQISSPMFIFPLLKKLFPEMIGYNRVKSMFDSVHDIIRKSFREHLDSFQPDHLRDYMDTYIKQLQEKKNDPTSSFHGEKGIQNMIGGIVNLFIGGTETTSNTLAWSLYYLCTYPEIQEKVAQEINQVVGHERLPSLEDKSKLPYTEAVVHEIQRFIALSYLGVPRVATRDADLGPYKIPKGTIVIPGLWEILHDPEYFEDPNTFKPERFIDPKTGSVKLSEKMIPFGMGKRVCIGITLAQNELFLFLSAFVQRFKFQDPVPKVLKPNIGIFIGCPDFKMTITERI